MSKICFLFLLYTCRLWCFLCFIPQGMLKLHQNQAPAASFASLNQFKRQPTKLYSEQSLQKTEMLYVLPLDSMNLPEITSLIKALASEPRKAVLSKTALLNLINKSPFCQIHDYIYEQNVVFFIEQDVTANYDAFISWLRKNKKESDVEPYDILICKKDHLIRIPSSHYEYKHDGEIFQTIE